MAAHQPLGVDLEGLQLPDFIYRIRVDCLISPEEAEEKGRELARVPAEQAALLIPATPATLDAIDAIMAAARQEVIASSRTPASTHGNRVKALVLPVTYALGESADLGRRGVQRLERAGTVFIEPSEWSDVLQELQVALGALRE